MASYFQSFRNSLMPKQLLRFALARLDVLDADALDIDNLDFAIGRRTVLEFRDVGLILPKLERLIGLPPNFSIKKAKVLVLRVTIPIDFFTSPITAEIDGVDIRLRVSSKEEQDRDRARKQKTPADVVPTAADLAQSFLETQRAADKKELERALAAESHDMGASVASNASETSDDSDLAYGTGQALTLPVFLTDFLQGIVDRMQIRIQGLRFQFDIEVPVDPGSTIPELVTFQLALESINVEGVTTPSLGEDGLPTLHHKHGKRHILLDNIRAFLISEANVFSTLTRSSSMPSSSSCQSPVAHEAATFSPTHSMHSDISQPHILAPPQPTDSTLLSESLDALSDPESLDQSHYPLQDSEDAFNIPYDLRSDDDEPGEPPSSRSTPRASFYAPPATLHRAHSELVQREPAAWSADLDREARSEPDLGRPMELSVDDLASSSMSSSSEVGEDLAQSHLYSHEEAQSMYMSAFSQSESTRLPNVMPGGWDDDADLERPQAGPPHFSPTMTAGPSLASLPPREQSPITPSPPSKSPQPQSPVEPPRFFAPASPRLASSMAHGSPELNPQTEDPEPQQDDIPTPRGSTKLAKEILFLESISIYLPSNHKDIEVTAPDLGRSTSPNVPGAFSIHSVAPSSPELIPARPVQPQVPQEEPDNSIEVILRPLQVRFDASIGLVLAMVVSRLMEAVQGQSSRTPDASASKAEGSTPDIKITLQEVSINFLEKLAGVADTPTRVFASRSNDFQDDILLKANLVNIQGSVVNTETRNVTNISIERFKFGYPNDDIIAFDHDPQPQMFESVASIYPSAAEDVSVKIVSWSDTSRAEIITLPLHIKLDLQRLDDVFGWFGGLSGFLNASTSMTSVTPNAPKSPIKSSPRARGVRFETPIRPDDRSAAKENKVDLRINGIRVDIIGKDCNVKLRTSALKLVHREGALGFHFSRIHLAGPSLRNSGAEPSVIVDVTDSRFEYILLPRDNDLERLLELITPSKVKFDENEDEIMVDTLLRQRRKGSVLSLTVGRVKIRADRLQQLSYLPGFVEELAKLGTVAKYLPEDDRPGLLTLGQIQSVDCLVDVGGRFGTVHASLKDLEFAHISMPALVAAAVGSIAVNRNKIEEIVGSPPTSTTGALQKPPVLMIRMIDDMELVFKVKLLGLSVDYHVPIVMDILGLAADATPQDFEESLAASVANLGDQAQTAINGLPSGLRVSTGQEKEAKPIKVDVALRDCLIGLNPLGLTSKLLIVLTDSHIEIVPGQREALDVAAVIKKASILLIDDVSLLESDDHQFVTTRRAQVAPSQQTLELCKKGYVNICQISSAKVVTKISKDADGEAHVVVDVCDDLLVLETCADSTQTLIALANALTPPTPPSKEIKYRTSVVPVQDLLASITADAFGRSEGDYDFENDFGFAQDAYGDSLGEDDFYRERGSVLGDSQYNEERGAGEELFDAMSSSILMDEARVEDTNDGVLLSTDSPGDASASTSDLSIQDDFFEAPAMVSGTAHQWNSKKNRYDQSNDLKVQRSPLKICVRDVHAIWNLFDGYDWARTREVISKAVQTVEAKAYERRARNKRRSAYDQDFEEEDDVIGDCLFNSIYINIQANQDPASLVRAINEELHDNATETESVATTAIPNQTGRAAGQHRPRGKSLKLNRSKRHKITFELKGVNADLVTFPPGSGETMSSIDVRVKELDVYDHVTTSTWRKFAMYDHDAGERELNASMVHLELINTKPVPSMPASEIVLKVTVLPLRLHVDQDALDFITRFFEFKDDSVPTHASPSDIPFIQRAEINNIPIKLDFKPHRVDYAGLRSGRTTEFMNFVILEEARLTLRHVIMYGVLGFDRLGIQLNDIWTDDVKGTQLPGILAGLAPVRSLVNASSGFRELIEIPIREYKKDGRIIRSIGKGATAFAKTTGTEVVKLGAKLALGTQNALQGAEGLLVQNPYGEGTSASGGGGDDWEEDEFPEEKKQISLYADQPLGIMQGMRGAYASLARDLSLARDAIIAVPAEVMESTNAQGAAVAVLKRAPTIILRPAIGATKAIGQTLLGATNSLDPQNRRRMDAVSAVLPFLFNRTMLTWG
ncbi:autophagy-related protein 2 [Podospora conica]|nr:autophagy-related protein 2 [Schizothecium conicum]